MDWNTNFDDLEKDNHMYLVTIRDGEELYVDYIELYRGEWCTEHEVVAWIDAEPYDPNMKS